MKLKYCLYLYMIFFAISNNAWAICNIPAGKYGHWVGCNSSDCPAGCYCPGNSENTESVSHNNLQSYCGGTKDYSTLWGGDKKTADRYLKRCPSNYPKTSGGAKSVEDCFADVGSKKVYNKDVKCDPGKYLPLQENSCVACKSDKRYVCPGGTFHTSLSADQGIKECSDSEQANSAKTACKKPATPTVEAPVQPAIEQKIEKIEPVAKLDKKTDLVKKTKQETGIHVDTGYYLPANATSQKVCSGDAKYCPGGDFTKSSSDQGIYDCKSPAKVNDKKDSCELAISKDQMRYGPNGNSSTPLTEQCWIKEVLDEYKQCILGE